MHFEDSVAIITGGASGLGEATVRKFHLKGCKVCIFDKDANKGNNLARELGKDVIFCPVDVCDPISTKEGIKEVIKTFHKVTINVNCAGVAIAEKTIGKDGIHNLDNFKKVVEVNLIGNFNVVCLCVEQMVKNSLDINLEKGVIINTASVAGLEGQKGQVAYAASKGGVASMTLPIARDLAREGIRCCCIAPGLFLTPMFEGLGAEVCEELSKDVLYPKRLGTPEEFAQFASQVVENNYLNGSVMRLDGGIRLA
ncbi:MAG: SDR family NAD(P)-dependent oxidoreductase [Pseudomonadota bacterium]|nr:SDR family NAD(P)-dependent oxidoreductase [Pseudomonadota bacterium]